MPELDNPILEPSELMYGKSDNANAPDDDVTIVSEENPEEAVVESDESANAQEDDEAPVYQIGTHEITESRLNEYKKAYNDRESMRADYSRKTAGVADKVKAETSKQVAEKLGDIDAKANTLVEHADTLKALLHEIEGGENLEELREQDYEEYQKTKETIETRRSKLKKASEEAQKSIEDAKRIKLREEQQLLFASNPEWLDDKGQPTAKWAEVSKTINDYARDAGYTVQDFSMLQSHKFMLTMLEAAELRQLKKKTTESKKVKEAPKLVKPTQQKSTKKGETRTAEEIMYG